MKIKFLLNLCLIGLLQTILFAKSDLELAYEAKDSGDNIKAINLFEKAANSGDIEAQKELGYIYQFGDLGITVDLNKSFEWHLKAAENGLSESQFQVGTFYVRKKDFESAKSWLKKAALQGNSNAMVIIGDMYYQSLGVKQDFSKAFKAYSSAIELKNPIAMYQLGSMYYNGHGVAIDYKKALQLFEQSGKYGFKKGKDTINQICTSSPQFCEQYR